jgi:hypothetical protein
MSRVLAGPFQNAPFTLLWVRQWGVWPSSEHWALYYSLRRQYGDSTSIDEKCGHLVPRHEHDDLISLLSVSVLFGWDSLLIREDGAATVYVKTGVPERAETWFRNIAEAGELSSAFKDAGVQRLS